MSSKTSGTRGLFRVNHAATGPFDKKIEEHKHTDANRNRKTFLNRRPLSLESRSSNGSAERNSEIMSIVGQRKSMARLDKGSISSTDSLLAGDQPLPPISSRQSPRTPSATFEPEVLNLPMLHQSKYLTGKEPIGKDIGTIRRSYDYDEPVIPVLIHSMATTERDGSSDDERDIDAVFEFNRRTSTEYDLEAGRQSNVSDDSCAISPFPPVEKNEQDKHKYLNEEAEKSNKKTRQDSLHNVDYLKRLKLDRKPQPHMKQREKKSKSIVKRMQTKQRFQLNSNDIFTEREDQPPVQPKLVDKSSKSTKLIIGFRYSIAVEEYYKGKLKHLANFAPLSETVLNHNKDQEDEVINGWLVKSVGAKALNLSARTLPSCNPIELRLRVQHARMRKMLDNKKPLSRGSLTSRSFVKSNMSFTKLQNIDEGQESKQVSPSEGHIREMDEEKPSVETNVISPVDDTDRSELFINTRSPTKTISLSLPVLTLEE